MKLMADSCGLRIQCLKPKYFVDNREYGASLEFCQTVSSRYNTHTSFTLHAIGSNSMP